LRETNKKELPIFGRKLKIEEVITQDKQFLPISVFNFEKYIMCLILDLHQKNWSNKWVKLRTFIS